MRRKAGQYRLLGFSLQLLGASSLYEIGGVPAVSRSTGGPQCPQQRLLEMRVVRSRREKRSNPASLQQSAPTSAQLRSSDASQATHRYCPGSTPGARSPAAAEHLCAQSRIRRSGRQGEAPAPEELPQPGRGPGGRRNLAEAPAGRPTASNGPAAASKPSAGATALPTRPRPPGPQRSLPHLRRAPGAESAGSGLLLEKAG